MKITETLYAATREEWRAWLEQNYSTAPEIWLYIHKKGSSRRSVSYEEAVEEALCFGWIDGLTKSVDGEKFAQRFSPRRKGSIWSDANRRRVRSLIGRGQMTQAGLAVVTFPLDEEADPSARRPQFEELPDDLRQELMLNEAAWTNFRDLPPSARKLYVYWITSAKREETRRRRLREATELLERNERLGMR